jgi:primosomal protein N' (replication factor Y)
MAKFARVIVDQSGSSILDYAIPPLLAERVQVGSRVSVPVRNRVALATVLELTDVTEIENLREIEEVSGSRPLVSPLLIRLAFWVADYYCCQPEAAMRCILPEAIRAGRIGHKKQLAVNLAREVTAEELDALDRKAPKQAAVIEFLRGAGTERVVVSRVVRECGVTHATIEQLAKKGFVETGEITVARDPFEGETFVPSQKLELNTGQRAAFEEVKKAVAANRGEASPKPILLHGVTGSGKTEIYLQAIEMVLERGETAIMLVPEISLTPQTVERFKSRFAGRDTGVAVLHSHLSAGERHDEWHKINEGRARIVIGARSAVFAPVENCGLIVVDEEHENSYKQEDAPRYHARDVAVLRAHFEKCAIILGSATPSIESYHNATSGKYQLLRLDQRVDDQKMPIIRVIDMRIEAQKQKGAALLSDKLCDAIRQRLEKKEQSILFLNRRGFSTSLLCGKCGHVCECPHCSVSLTFHRAANRIVCHICGHTAVAPSKCPECRDPGIHYSGAGTEKVEEAVARFFPKAVIRRMDADAMQRKEAYRETLGAFRAGKIDILVGTQMIAKGLHFPNVTLVGIINADLALHLPDFRAGERTFQLLTQVAGRAGRGEVEGEVFVQSFTPFHPAIQFARHHDFDGFWEQEIEFRKQWDYPPFTHVVLITLRAPQQNHASFSAQTLARRIADGLPAGTTLSEAAPAPLEKSHGNFRYHLMLRTAAILRLSRHLRAVFDKLTFPEDVIVSVDIDPYQLL